MEHHKESTEANREDERLVAAYLAGDERALTLLIERHITPIYNFTYRLVGNAHDAEDVTQEAFFKAWRNLTRYRMDKGARFRTWLFAIAHNTAIDLFRKNKKRALPFSDFSARGEEDSDNENPILNRLVDTQPLPDDAAIRSADVRIMKDAIQNMPPHYRDVLLLYYQNDMSFDEMSAILGRPLSTVKSQYRRGVALLKKCINTTRI